VNSSDKNGCHKSQAARRCFYLSPQLFMETALAGLLAELSDIQTDLLAVLADKRHRLLTSDIAAMDALRDREQALVARLQACQDRRLALLAQAAAEGLPSHDLQSLAAALPHSERQKLTPTMREATARMRLLQHHSLTNWVLVQRTLIHLSQVLEIIATGGRLKPTYGKDDSVNSGGFLVDQAA
jgi:flagellar biosynthesis/type III secretory pathway chaperone